MANGPTRRSMSIRDSQRSRVYASDKALIAISKPLPTVADIERYITSIMSMKRVQDEYPKAFRGWDAPRVRDGRGHRSARGCEAGITMPTWCRNEAIVIHEIAHTIARRVYGVHSIAGHGWEFCAIYLQLTLYAMGREAHDVLKAAFKANRVRFRAPRKGRPLSPDARAAMIARLSVYNGTAATE